MSWRAYARYEPSGIEWLDVLPEGWSSSTVANLRAAGENSFTDGDWVETPYITDSGIRLVQTGNIGIGSYREQGFRYISEDTFDELRCKDVLPGDVLICRLGDPVGRSCIAPDLGMRMITSVDVCILRPLDRRLSPYLNYVFNCSPYQSYVASLVRGSTRDRVSRKMLGRFVVPVPPPDSVESIVDFLDYETAKIDALIGKQEQLIATLREDRTATITHAVTKGLDPDAEMKDSGVEWLGTVPAHWHQTQLRHLLDRIEQGVSPQAYAELAEEGWGVLKSGCVNGGTFVDSQHKKLPDDFQIDPATVVHEGDLLVCRASGSVDFVGSTAIVHQLRYQLIMSDKIFRLIPSALVLPDYLEWAMNSRMYREQVSGAISGAEGLANNLPMSALKTFRFPVPPPDEQVQISVYLDQRCETIDGLIAKANEVVGVMREYRSALITDAVTGKIDVRGAA